jgi:hypothetical protein
MSPDVGFEPTTNVLTVSTYPVSHNNSQTITKTRLNIYANLFFVMFCHSLPFIGTEWGKIGEKNLFLQKKSLSKKIDEMIYLFGYN